MILSCPRCSRQHEVGHLTPGSWIRCGCELRLKVEAQDSHELATLECDACGGPVDRQSKACSYCGSTFEIEADQVSRRCPECLARVPHEGRFCPSCGVTIRPQTLAALGEDVTCPRCSGELRARSLESASVIECQGCHGLWLSPARFEKLCQWAEGREDTLRFLASRPPPRHRDAHPVGYLACLVCKDLMVRRNYGMRSGVIIDVCRAHGVWLDHGEARKIIDFVKAVGLGR